jgi:hypothetical protein
MEFFLTLFMNLFLRERERQSKHSFFSIYEIVSARVYKNLLLILRINVSFTA